MANKPTQNDRVLDFLKTHSNGITSQDAFERFGITRLSGRIFDLRAMGYNISTEQETSKNRYGDSTTYARYKLDDEVTV